MPRGASSTILVRGRDQPVSDDRVAVVQHRRLAVCDPVRRLVELEPEATSCGLDPSRNRGRAVAELRLDPLGGGVEPTADGDLRARERRARADDDGVRRRACAEDVERLGCREPEAATLARREPPEAVVTAELVPVLARRSRPAAARARGGRGTRGSRRRRGSTPPGSRACARRRARRARPRPASRPCPARRAGTRHERACADRARRACSSDPSPGRRRGRAGAAPSRSTMRA